jgi:hypothetical protein
MPMGDIAFIALVLAFFLVAIGYARVAPRL